MNDLRRAAIKARPALAVLTAELVEDDATEAEKMKRWSAQRMKADDTEDKT